MRIIIVGGGFAGVRVALDLAKYKNSNSKIVLISDTSHFEYHPALYRVVTGRSPLEVCIPLQDIFQGKNTEIVCDSITNVDTSNHQLKGASGSTYHYDILILALGSETAYFNVPGLREYSFGFKSIQEALKLKRHLHEIFADCQSNAANDKVCVATILIVGGGASGVEVAGELAVYTKKLAKKHNLDSSLVTIELVGSSPRLLPTLPEYFTQKIHAQLQRLGVNIFLNRAILKEELETVYLKDMEMKTKTVIWTAGVTPNALYKKIAGFTFDKKGRVIVDEYLHPMGLDTIYVVGDAAATSYSGMAQTAIGDGRFVASNIIRSLQSKPLATYHAKSPFYAIPVGPSWAAVLIKNISIYGMVGWWLRRLADLRFFLSILPFNKAFLAFQNGKALSENCSVCSSEEI